MPNWTTTPGVTVVNGGESATITSDIVISPAAGYSIVPENFIIGGATEESVNTWSGGNVGNIVKKVEFIQSNDDVLARVHCEEAHFSADSDIFVDIDESQIDPVVNSVYGACIDVEYPFPVNATATVVGLTGTTVTQNQVGDATTPANWTVTRYENEMLSTLLFTATITPASGYHLSGAPSVELANNASLPNNFNVSQAINGSSGVVTVTYTETASSQSLTPCEFGNKVYINYTVLADSVTSTGTVHGVNVNSGLGRGGGGVEIKINGDSSAQYNIAVKNTTSNEYYNWDGTWVSGSTSKTDTISNGGINTHVVVIPSATSNVDHDITLSSVSGSTLGSSVPVNAGDLQIKQYGATTMAVSLLTNDTTQYGALPSAISVTRPTRYTGDRYYSPKTTFGVVKGKTSGSSTRVILSSLDKKVESGMLVLGDNIPHNTTVKSVERSTMVLSAAVNISTTQVLKCYSNTADIIPISFQVQPNGNTLSVNSAIKPSSILWGADNVKTKVSGNHIASSTILLADNSGIVDSMSVTGAGISANTTVSSVDYSGLVTLDQAHTGPTDGSDIYFKSLNPQVEVAYLNVEEAAGNITIKGYLLAPMLHGVKVQLYLDDIINVT